MAPDAAVEVTAEADPVAVTPPPATLAVGEGHACWIRPDRRVVCWGENDAGQVDGRPGPTGGPRVVPGVVDAVEIAAGGGCSCARTGDGRVVCWGRCDAMRREDRPGYGDRRYNRWWGSTAGGFGCSIASAGRIYCSRDGTAGSTRRESEFVDFAAPVADAAVTAELVCVRDAQGAVACLGTADRAERTGGERFWLPHPVEGLAGAARLVPGAGMICALKATGKVSCVLPRPVTTRDAGPGSPGLAVLDVMLDDAAELAGRVAFCAARRGGAAACWGEPVAPADGGLPGRIDPVAVAGATGLTAIAVDEIACGLDDAGILYCWDVAELAGGGRVRSLGSLGVTGIAGGVQVAVRSDVACVRDTSGIVYCRRPGDAAALPVPLVTDAVNIVAAHDGFCALRRGGWLSCWPADNPVAESDVFTASFARQLSYDVDRDRLDGVGLAAMGEDICIAVDGAWDCWQRTLDAAHRPETAVVAGVPDPAQLAIGDGSLYALSRAGAVIRWSDAGGRVKATPVEELAGAVAVAPPTDRGPCALMPDGAVACMTGEDIEIRGAIRGLESGVVTLAGGRHGRGCAVMRDGTARCWVRDPEFHAPMPTATPVAGVDGVLALAVGETHVCALLAGSDVICWGDDNHHGQLGRPSSDRPAAPALVAGLPPVAEIAAGWFSTCAITKSGEVWCWGSRDDPENGWRPRRIEGLLEL
ncbi:MAG: hypothetical protein HY907_08465 [Deltaproteobacteria bacterium]|nr:hypothetical protein [Deltaproteobacteria bacterium]